MTHKTTFNGIIVYSSDKYKHIFLDEMMRQDGSPNIESGILSFFSPIINGPAFDDWIESFREFFWYLIDRGWCIKWTESPDTEISLERTVVFEDVGLNVLYKGEILAGSDEFKYVWLQERLDSNGALSGIDIFASRGGRPAISAKYQAANYREVLIFLKQMGWAVLWTTYYPNLVALERAKSTIKIDINDMQQQGFISEINNIPSENDLLFKIYQSQSLLLLKRGARLAVDASNEAQLVVELDDLTLQQLINVLQRHLETKSKDELEFKLASRGVKISPISIEDLSFYIAEDTDY